MTQDDILARLAVLEDREALRGLINTYQRHADEGDHDGMIACFVADGIFNSPGATFNGRAEMQAAFPMMAAQAKQRFHMLANLQFEILGDVATGHGCMHFVLIRDPAAPWLSDGKGRQVGGANGGGHYDWRFVRTAQGWRIAHQKLVISWTGSRAAP